MSNLVFEHNYSGKSEFDLELKNASMRFLDQANISVLSKMSAFAVGCGSIGSWAILSSSKMGVSNWTIYDMDTVEIHNTSNQIWGPYFVGKSKVQLMGTLLSRCSMVQSIKCYSDVYTDQSLAKHDIILSCVDNMKTRKTLFENSSKSKFFFDARIGGGQLNVYVFNPSNKESRAQYENTLFDDENAAEEKCTDVGGVPAPLIAASVLCTSLSRFSENQDIPFMSAVFGAAKSFDVFHNGFTIMPKQQQRQEVSVEKKPPVLSKLMNMMASSHTNSG